MREQLDPGSAEWLMRDNPYGQPGDRLYVRETFGGMWLLGCLAMLVSFWRAHARYAKELGAREHADGLLYCANKSMSPAVIGLLRHAIDRINDLRSEVKAEIRDVRNESNARYKELRETIRCLIGIQITTLLAVVGLLASAADFP